MAIASLTHGSRVLRFRTNPNSIRWTYSINKREDPTYGGKVVQLLSVSLNNLTVTADAGAGGWPYLYSVATFFRDMLHDQQRTGVRGVFAYPARGWQLGVYATQFPFKDAVSDVRREFTMNFNIQEDLSGMMEQATLRNEIARLQEGVGWKRSPYNDPDLGMGATDDDGDDDDNQSDPSVSPGSSSGGGGGGSGGGGR